MEKLSDRQLRFVEEYLVDCNTRAAARRAGFWPKYGYKLKSNPAVSEAIRCEMEKRKQRLEVSTDSVVEELRTIAFSCIEDFIFLKKTQNDLLIAEAKSFEEIPRGLLPAISELKNTSRGIQIKLASKTKALELLAKYLGILKRCETVGEKKDLNIDLRVFDENGELKEIINPTHPELNYHR